MCVSVCGEHFKHTASEFEDRDIKRTSTKVEDGNLHVLVCFVHAISQCSSCRLVHDTLYFQTGNLTSFLGGLTLRVREVCGYGNHSFGNLLTEIVLGGLLHLLKNHGANLLWGILTSVDIHTWGVVVATYNGVGHTCYLLLNLIEGLTHESLDREDGLLGVCDGLTFSGVTHLALATVYKCHDGRSGALALAVGYYYGLVALKY